MLAFVTLMATCMGSSSDSSTVGRRRSLRGDGTISSTISTSTSMRRALKQLLTALSNDTAIRNSTDSTLDPLRALDDLGAQVGAAQLLARLLPLVSFSAIQQISNYPRHAHSHPGRCQNLSACISTNCARSSPAGHVRRCTDAQSQFFAART